MNWQDLVYKFVYLRCGTCVCLRLNVENKTENRKRNRKQKHIIRTRRNELNTKQQQNAYENFRLISHFPFVSVISIYKHRKSDVHKSLRLRYLR